MLRDLVVLVLLVGFLAAVAWGNISEDWCERRFGRDYTLLRRSFLLLTVVPVLAYAVLVGALLGIGETLVDFVGSFRSAWRGRA